MFSELHHFKTGRRNFLKAAIGYYSCRGVAAATRRFAKHLTKARGASSFLFTPWLLRKHCTDHGPPIKAGVRTDQSTDEQAGPPPFSACVLYRKAHGLSSFCPGTGPKLPVTFTSQIITQSQRAVEGHGTARACSCGEAFFWPISIMCTVFLIMSAIESPNADKNNLERWWKKWGERGKRGRLRESDWWVAELPNCPLQLLKWKKRWIKEPKLKWMMLFYVC